MKLRAFLGVSMFALVVLTLNGCGGGGGVKGSDPGTAIIPSSPGLTASAVSLSRVSGGVFDADGAPVAGVQVTMRAEEVQVQGARVAKSGTSQAAAVTDDSGVFAFDLTATPKEGERIVLKLSKGGYIDNNSVFRIEYNAVENGELFLPVKLIRAPQGASSATVAEITRADGTTQVVTPRTVTDPDTGLTVTETTVTIDETVQELKFSLPSPASANVSSVAFSIGGAASGGRSAAKVLGLVSGATQVTGSLYYGDPTNEDALATFPGEFVTKDGTGKSSGRAASAPGDGEEGVLVTAGFTQINLEDSSGNEIKSFSGGAEVGVKMRVPDGLFNPETGAAVAEGDNVPIFTYDEDSGEWKVEYNADGSVKRGTVMRDSDGLYVPFTTDHLSWFNLDWKGVRCEGDHPVVRAVDGAGAAVNNFTVYPRGKDGSIIGWGGCPKYTNDGVVSFMNAPADISWTVTVEAEGFTSDPVEIVSCGDVTVTLKELNAVSETTVSAMCGGSAYANVSVMTYQNGARIASAKTGADGKVVITLPAAAGVMVYGTSGDSCKDMKSSSYTTAAAGVAGGVSLSYNNSCCPNHVEPLKVVQLTPDSSSSYDSASSVSGAIKFAANVTTSSVPSVTVTLKQGDTTILNAVPASSVGTVAWADSRTLGLTVAKAENLEAGKTYSYTINLTPANFVSSGGGTLELSSYLTSVPGVVSYTATSLTGTFKTTAGAANQLPVPDAGADRTVAIGTQVELDGSASSDPDGDTLTYKWALISGPSVTLSGDTAAKATFTPAEAGTYIFTLTVDDGRGGVMRDKVTITACSIACSADTQCADGNSLTIDTCLNASACGAACMNESTSCSIKLDKVNYEPGEQMAITFTGSNAGTTDLECGALVYLKKDKDTTVWNSFNDDIFITIPAGQGLQKTFQYTVPEAWANTDSPSGSDYAIDPVDRAGNAWKAGDNFNIIVAKCQTVPCSSDADCNDNLSYTADTCANPGLCSSSCANTCDAACLNDSDCNDNSAQTKDVCVNFVSCDPAVACAHTVCGNSIVETGEACDDGASNGQPNKCNSICSGTTIAACGNSVVETGETCDDGNTATETCAYGEASCAVCNATCQSAAGATSRCGDSAIQTAAGETCDDGNATSDDGCSATCQTEVSATCGNGAVEAGEQCDDGNTATEACAFGETSCAVCNATCQNAAGATSYCGDTITDAANGETCDDGNTADGDGCSATCGCEPACGSGADCDDSDPNTIDECTNPGVCGAACNNCIPSCVSDAECDDGNGLTIDTCSNAGTCAAACSNTTCTPACVTAADCNDGNPATADMCVNANTCGAACANVAGQHAIGTGWNHSCKVISDGTVMCWGNNDLGQLGDGTVMSSNTPVSVVGISDAVAVTQDSDGYHTCAILSGGGVKCWGDNSYGELGDGGATGSSSVPLSVPVITNAVAIAGGWFHTCVVLSGGNMKCWGRNDGGQLGDGTNTDSLTPVDVLNITDAIAVSAGTGHTCAILSGGGVKCWGWNDFGQLGDGDGMMTNSSIPVDVMGVTDAVSISLGWSHSCIVLSGGGVKCWGWNNYGQLGEGSIVGQSVPVDVIGILDAVSLAAGGEHSCAVLSGGGVKCWGWNSSGQLGDGTGIDSLTPVDVSGITDAIAISSGEMHTCVLLSGGGVRCWGFNEYGQIGNGTWINSLIPVSVVGF